MLIVFVPQTYIQMFQILIHRTHKSLHPVNYSANNIVVFWSDFCQTHQTNVVLAMSIQVTNSVTLLFSKTFKLKNYNWPTVDLFENFILFFILRKETGMNWKKKIMCRIAGKNRITVPAQIWSLTNDDAVSKRQPTFSKHHM